MAESPTASYVLEPPIRCRVWTVALYIGDKRSVLYQSELKDEAQRVLAQYRSHHPEPSQCQTDAPVA